MPNDFTHLVVYREIKQENIEQGQTLGFMVQKSDYTAKSQTTSLQWGEGRTGLEET